MALAEATGGISDEQLAALVAGRWVDDDARLPGWERWVTVDGGEGGSERWRQWVIPSVARPEWQATFGPHGEGGFLSFEEALKWCDDRVGNNKIEVSSGTATKQEDLFGL